jgi:predicted transcriptional regulator
MKILPKQTAKPDLIKKFNALGDATRFKLFELLLKDDGICVSELAQEVKISNAGVSQQLKVMEHAGIIIRKRKGQKICYEVDSANPDNKQLLGLVKMGRG